jgi:pyruvate dehydrogenase E2 component (dihydrolipoamide acetyltransferase)
MAELIRMPRMSDTMTEAVIVAWHKKVGDKVKPGDVLAEVETDKATMELESYNEGTLLYIGVENGKAVAVDGVLAIVGKEGEDYSALLNAAAKHGQAAPANNASVQPAQVANPPAAAAEKTTGEQSSAVLPEGAKVIRMPLLSDTMTEGKIVQWNKKIGDKVKADDVLCDVETDKATMEVVGYEEGTLLFQGVEAGKAAKVNEIIAIVGKPGTDVKAYVEAQKSLPAAASAQPASTIVTAQPSATIPAAHAASTPVMAVSETDGRIKASPLARKMAKEKGIDLKQIHGSGDSGRITRKDVDGYTPSTTSVSPMVTPFVPQAGGEGYIDLPLSQMRKTIARRLSESKFSSPHFYLTMEINMDQAVSLRESINKANPIKVSFNDFVIKACAMALVQHPAVNSSWMGDFIRQNRHVHIGSAVAIPEGLIVPVIKFANQKSLVQIAAEARELYGKARDKKLDPQEFSGNTFTISNLGMMDIEEFTAIINPPDSAILAVGKIKEVVVKKTEGFGVTQVMKITLSCDHRSVDGAVGAAFLQSVKLILENPVSMLL